MGNEKWEMRKWGNGEMERQRTVGVKEDSGVYCCAKVPVRYRPNAASGGCGYGRDVSLP